MKLRNGKIYEYNETVIQNMKCSICYQYYREAETILSCNETNLYKHNFHKQCIIDFLQYQKKNFFYISKCPVCNISLDFLKMKYLN